MKTTHLGQEIRLLRKQSGLTLRGLAVTLDVSAAHLSDIEHNRRRPSEELLRRIARELRGVGATFQSLERLVTGIDPETREWAASTPGVRQLLRMVKKSGKHPLEILPALEKVIDRNGNGKRRREQASKKDRTGRTGRKVRNGKIGRNGKNGKNGENGQDGNKAKGGRIREEVP